MSVVTAAADEIHQNFIPSRTERWRSTTGREIVLHYFYGDDGTFPDGALVFDAAGHLYGTTSGGAPYKAGTVFEVAP